MKGGLEAPQRPLCRAERQIFMNLNTEQNGSTITFQITDERERQIKALLSEVYVALQEKGYNPINQLVGYIISEDPTYITNYKNARSNIRKIDREELLNILIKSYLQK